ncbi:hypothetical protein CRE_03507 [Caenorhabditis remanei]|uniref:Uncharacterized protein n=1 Tax=Caenorhabditis remanei TaxID=31234 RepID=E3NL22_CAERE|nr:hypothetical protein CRE_03507 [Caenorhabditis remanei]
MPSESPPAMAVTFALPPRPSTVPPMTSTVTQEPLIEGHPNEIRDSEDVTTMMENPNPLNRKISIDNCNNQEIITNQLSIDSNQPSTSQAPPPQQPVKPAVTVLLDQERYLPIDELLTAMEACGFDNYSEPMRIFLQKYRQAKKMSGPPHITHPNYVRPPQFAADPPVQPLFYETENGGTKYDNEQ